tara:strand:- start:53 stop:259 length:207 start_codon:yes stop_codon:yes gene_type:complete
MIPSLVLPMIGNLLKDLILSKSQDLAKEHLEEALEKNLPPAAKELLDKAIAEDRSHKHKSLLDLIDGK